MSKDSVTPPRPGTLRYLSSIFYDTLLLSSVLVLATAAVLPLNDGNAIPPDNPFYSAYLLGLSFLYFGWCWSHGGQTLGMRAWRIRLRHRGGDTVGWRHAAVRFSCALISLLPFGAGFLWAIVDREHLSWHDRCSGTMLVVEKKLEGGGTRP